MAGCPWLDELPLPASTPLPTSVDVAILGLGLPALMVAVQAQERGLHVALLPTGPLSEEPSLQGLGLLRQVPWYNYEKAAVTYGREFVRNVCQLGRESLQALNDKVVTMPHDLGWFRTGSLTLCSEAEAADLERSASRLNGDGCRAQFWDADQLQKRMGQCSLDNALYIADDSAVDPGYLWYALLDEFCDRGGLVGEDLWAPHADGEFTSRVGKRLAAQNWVDAREHGDESALPRVQIQINQSERVHKMYPMGMHLLSLGLSCRQGGRGEVLVSGPMEGSGQPLEALSQRLPRMQGVLQQAAWSLAVSLAVDSLPLVGRRELNSKCWLLTAFQESNLGLAWGLASWLVSALAGDSSDVTLCSPSRVTLQSHKEF